MVKQSLKSVSFQAFVSSMVGELEALIQSVNSSLEKTSEQVVASMPKIFQNVQVPELELQSPSLY